MGAGFGGLELVKGLAEAGHIADHAADWPVAWMCDALEVSASGYHAWLVRPDSATARPL